MIQRIYKQGGVQGLYRGLGADSIATLLSSFIYFYCYTALRNLQEKMNKSMGKSSVALNVYQELFLGAEAALISRFFTSPVSNITTRLQTGKKQQSFMEIAKDIYDEKSITGFWTGKKRSGGMYSLCHSHLLCYRLQGIDRIGFQPFHHLFCIRKTQGLLLAHKQQDRSHQLPDVFILGVGEKRGDHDHLSLYLFAG
jgi:hypothetical protein